jgi:hypothetical protein
VKCLLTSLIQLDIALKATLKAGILRYRVYIIEMPMKITDRVVVPSALKTVTQFILEGSRLKPLESEK